MPQKHPYTPYRKALAWIGFATLYIVLPVIIIASYYIATNYADHANQVYSQTFNTTTTP